MDKPIAAFVLLICFSFFYSEYPYASRLQAYLIIGYAGLFYYLINRQNGRNDIIRLVWFLVIFGSLFATSGLIFAGVNLPGDSSVSFSFVNSNHFAGYLEMIALLAMGLAFAYGGGKRFLLLALCVFISIAIFFSLSRGGVLGFLSGTAFFAFYYVRRKKISTLTLIAFAFSLFCFTVWLGNEAFFERMATLKEPLIAGKERLIIWRGASGIIGDNFWLGTGIGTFRYSFPRYLLKPVQTAISHAHNDYLEVIAETGIAGGLILLSGVIILFLKAMKCFSGDERSRLQPVGIGALSGCFALLVHGMTDFNFHIPSNAILFVVFSSVIVNSSALIQRPHSEKRMRMIDINIQAKFILPLYTAAAICAFISFAAVISPYIGEIHMKEARKHQLSEDYDSAYAHLNKALFWDPGNAGNMAAMGDLLITRSFLARSNSEKEWYIIRSLKYFEDATAACPVNSYFYSKKGFVLDRMGRANEAETALAKSVELAPANSFARYTLASFYIQHKDMDKAYDSYAHLLRLDLSFFPKVFESIWKVRPDYEQMKRAIPEIPAIRV
ncbi:MAG: O-antigen ligase family protein [Nitrospirae bacterium]|nr:O-antigen ligase family protein [Nitrospirota bacterium]